MPHSRRTPSREKAARHRRRGRVRISTLRTQLSAMKVGADRQADLVRISGRRAQDKIRHDPGAISAVAIQLARQGRRAKERLAS